MVSLNEIVGLPSEVPLHPLVSDWKRRIVGNPKPILEIHQTGKSLGVPKTELYLQFTEQGKVLPKEPVTWDEELNAGLLQLGVRAADENQEALRFALILRGHMRKIEREFGDGYVNSVLVEFIREIDISNDPDLNSLLQHISVTPPLHSPSSKYCREKIANELRGRYDELTKMLGYSTYEATGILTKMIVQFLDDRFSVGFRRRMGLLRE